MSEPPFLLILSGRSAGVRYGLEREETVIGRASSSSVQLIDDAVSRRHAIIRRSDADRFVLEDLGSQNGVRLNGLRVEKSAVLAPGDALEIGETTFLFSPPIELIGGLAGARLAIASAGEGGWVDRPVSGDERGAQEIAGTLIEILGRAAAAQSDHARSIHGAIGEALSLIARRFDAERALIVATAAAAGGARSKVLASVGEGIVTSSRTVLSKVLEEKRAIVSGDAASDLAFRGGVSILAGEIRSLLAAPLLVGGKIIGLVHLDRRSRDAYGPADLEALIPAANLLALVTMAVLGMERTRKALRGLERAIEPPWIVSESPAFAQVVREVRRAAQSEATVLLEGETGTGKEVLARLCHAESDRARGPFVAVNCGALPPGLEEAELFGHEKGAFTGAVAAREGLFEAASGGTLFLDEIGEAPPALQVKLLRAIQERVIQRLGAAAAIEVDVRIIAATSRKLDALVAEGRLRPDLFHRLAVVHLHVPPLRARREDLAPLARGWVERCCRAAGIVPKRISDEALEALSRRRWSGNVRELKNTIERLVIMSEGPEIGLGDLPSDLLAGSDLADRAIQRGESLEEAVAALERDLILRAMARTGGVKSAVAHALGISRVTLDAKIKLHAIEWRRT